MPYLIVSLILISSLHLSYGLHQHQIGTFDWYQKNIGPVRYAGFYRSSVIAGTSAAVLAAIRVQDNEIIWRQVLPEHEFISGFFLDQESASVYTMLGSSTDPNMAIWSASDGSLKMIRRSFDSSEQIEKGNRSSFQMLKTASLIVAWSPNSIHAFDCTTAEKVYSIFKPVEHVAARGSAVNLIDAVFRDESSKIKFDTIDQSGVSVRSKSLITENFKFLPISGSNGLLISSSFVQQVISGDITEEIHFDEPAGNFVSSFILDLSLVELKFASGRRIFIDLNKKEVIPAVSPPENVQSEHHSGGIRLLQTPDKIYFSKSSARLGSIPFDIKEYGLIISAYCKDGICCVSSDDGSFSCFDILNKSLLWNRYEAIASTHQVAVVESPTQLLLASLDQFPSFIPRLGIQYKLAKQFLADSVASFSGFSLSTLLSSENALPFDNSSFSMKKIILILSQSRLFALCSLTGQLLWSRSLVSYHFNDSDYIGIFSLPELYLIGGHYALQIDLQSGSVNAVSKFDQKIITAVEYPMATSPASSFLFVSLSSGVSHIVPESRTGDVANLYPSGLYYNHLSVTENSIDGYHVEISKGPRSTELTWRYAFPSESVIASSVCSNPNEFSPNPAIVKPDQILFKHQNRPFRAVLTASGTTLSLIVVDGQHGNVLYRNEHPHCGQRLEHAHVVIIENVVVYSFYNSRDMLFNLGIVELYHSGPAISQAFVFPSAICSLGSTETLRGITMKQIMVGLCSGQLYMVDLFSLTSDATWQQAPPLIAINPLNIINYDRAVSRIRKISSSGTELESATIMVSAGLDIFTTRTHPSRPFDLLNSDFNLPLLLATVSTVAVGIFITSGMAKRKQRSLKWL